MRPSTLITTIATCIIAIVAVIYGTAYFCCEKSHSSVSHGCGCCGGGAAGVGTPHSNPQPDNLGKYTTVVTAPPNATESIKLTVLPTGTQDIFFSTVIPTGTPALPIVQVYKINSVGAKILQGTINYPSGSYKIQNYGTSTANYEISVQYISGTPFETLTSYEWPPDYHDYDGVYSKDGVSAVISIH